MGGFVVYADSPRGHIAAVSGRTGEVTWRAGTARTAAQIAVTPTVVWSAPYGPGRRLFAQDATSGKLLRSFPAPDGGAWETLASYGDTLYALSYDTDEQHDYVTTFTDGHRIRSALVSVPQSCNSVAGPTNLYLACFSSDDSVNRVDPRSGAVLARTVQPALRGGQNLAYRQGSLYFVTAARTGTQMNIVNRVSATMLAPQARSAPMSIFTIAAAAHKMLAGQSNGENSGRVLVIDPTTLTLTSSIAVLSQGYPMFLNATGQYAYIVQHTGYAGEDFPSETLIRITLPG